MRLLLIIPFLLNCLLLTAVENKKMSFHHYTTNDGLSHNEVRVIDQAPNGVLWLGTQNGMCSFDGYRFRVYKHQPNDSTTICGDKIYAILAAKDGNIWVGTSKGLSVFDPKNETANEWTAPGNETSIFVYHLTQGKGDYIWLSSNKGNYRINPSTFQSKEILKDKKVSCFSTTDTDQIWAGQTNRIEVISASTGDVNTVIPIDGAGEIKQVIHEKLGVHFVVGENGLYKVSGDNIVEQLLTSKALVGNSLEINYSCLLPSGKLALSSYGGGVVICNMKTRQVESYTHDPKNINTISSNDVYQLFVSNDDVLWVGTQEGLDLFDPARHRFNYLLHNPDNSNSLGHYFIQSIFQDSEGIYWIGTRENGLDRLEFQGNSYTDPQFSHFTSDKSNPDKLWGSYVMNVYEDSKKRLWVATWGGGLNLMDRKTKKFKHFTFDPEIPNSLPSDVVTSVLEDHLGNIWIATTGGLSLLVEQDGNFHFKNFTYEPYNSKSISMNAIFSLLEDSKGRIWLAINGGGLNLMHSESDGQIWFEHFRHHPSDSTSISNDEVYVLFEDEQQNLWAGTSGGGINRVVESRIEDGKSTFKFKAYTEKEGLADNEVNAILEDDDGFLWISTNKGITRFHPTSEKMVNYSLYDGLLKGKYRKNAALKDNNGYLWFGGAAGINFFHPSDFNTDMPVLKPMVSEVLIDDNRLFPGNGLVNDSKFDSQDNYLELRYPFNRFKLSLASGVFSGAQKIKYYYKLEGFDSKWQMTSGDNPSVFYSGLPAGQYELLVKLGSEMGETDESTTSIKLKVIRSYWYIYLIITIIVGIILVYLLHQKITRSKALKETQKRSSNIDLESNSIIEALHKLMEEERLFLDANLLAADLAQAANISQLELTQVLNYDMGKNFADFVNHYRVKEVQKQLVLPENAHKTIMAIAWDCGFNSKSAFNRIFKNITGQTPSQYQKNAKVS